MHSIANIYRILINTNKKQQHILPDNNSYGIPIYCASLLNSLLSFVYCCRDDLQFQKSMPHPPKPSTQNQPTSKGVALCKLLSALIFVGAFAELRDNATFCKVNQVLKLCI